MPLMARPSAPKYNLMSLATPTGFNLKPFGAPVGVVPLSTEVKFAATSASTRPFKWITRVPGFGTAYVLGARKVLSMPAATLPVGVLAIPQALLLLLVLPPAPYGAAN